MHDWVHCPVKHAREPEGADGLLRSVCADPEDDNLRLIVAEFYDDHRMHDRAEFIRIQIEMARLDGKTLCRAMTKLSCDCDLCSLRRRAKELFRSQPKATPSLTASGAVYVATDFIDSGAFVVAPSGCDRLFLVTYHRGFWADVRCNLRDFLDAAPLLFTHPITSVTLIDRYPLSIITASAGGMSRCWELGGVEGNSPPSTLPAPIWEELRPDLGMSSSAMKGYLDSASALSALSQACVKYGRRLVKVPGPYDLGR